VPAVTVHCTADRLVAAAAAAEEENIRHNKNTSKCRRQPAA
jgi:hypothetical protein